MTVQEIPISKIKQYKGNAKKHPQSQIDRIAKSLEQFGWQQPIVLDTNNVIVAGHGRYLAAKQLGLKKVPCKYADELSEDEIKAFRILDNRIAESEIDVDIELAEIGDIDFDFDAFDLDLFSMDEIEEVSGYDEMNDDREHFTAAFTFPTAQKERILRYLRKHKQEIADEIVQKAINND